MGNFQMIIGLITLKLFHKIGRYFKLLNKKLALKTTYRNLFRISLFFQKLLEFP